VRPWQGDTAQVGSLAGAPPRASGRRGVRGGGPRRRPSAARWAPGPWVVRLALSPVATRSISSSGGEVPRAAPGRHDAPAPGSARV